MSYFHWAVICITSIDTASPLHSTNLGSYETGHTEEVRAEFFPSQKEAEAAAKLDRACSTTVKTILLNLDEEIKEPDAKR